MATLIVVGLGNLEIPATVVTIKDKELQMEVCAVSGKYRGTLGASGEIAGEWSDPNTIEEYHKRAKGQGEPT